MIFVEECINHMLSIWTDISSNLDHEFYAIYLAKARLESMACLTEMKKMEKMVVMGLHFNSCFSNVKLVVPFQPSFVLML